MSLPGFTAQVSLSKISKDYTGMALYEPGESGVLPQFFRCNEYGLCCNEYGYCIRVGHYLY